MIQKVFDCKKCGQCCEGKGGIVLSSRDLERLAAFLGQSQEFVAREYAEISNCKLKIRCGDDGWCIFFRQGTGCSVHEGKPAICRAWPYFRGNMEDAASFAMAKDFCPGIRSGASFAEFVAEGQAYLRKCALFASDYATDANSLPAEPMKKI